MRAGINTNGTIFTKSVQLLGFANDIDIIARKFETMAETYIRLKSEARRIGLVINVSKTKYMMAKSSKEESPRPPIYIDGDEIEAQKFRGALWTEIELTLDSGELKFAVTRS